MLNNIKGNDQARFNQTFTYKMNYPLFDKTKIAQNLKVQ